MPWIELTNIVFLDFDGVLNHSEWTGPGELDPACVAQLDRITSQTDASVVLSTAWRYAFGIDYLADLLASKGFGGEVVAKTPEMSGHQYVRQEEIRFILDAVGPGVSFVILEDVCVMPDLEPWLVRTNPGAGGLTEERADRAIELLRDQPVYTAPRYPCE